MLQSFCVCSYRFICLCMRVCVLLDISKHQFRESCVYMRVLWFGLFVCICMFILLRSTFQLPDYLCASLPSLARPPGFRSTHICSSTLTLPLSPRRCSVGVRVMLGKPQLKDHGSHTHKPLCLRYVLSKHIITFKSSICRI